ncbi:MAG TPA: DUF512 domain-containing protein [Dissulfurispiraceae bacterium]
MQAKSSSGAEIESIREGSVAWRAGLRPGDRLVAINGHRINDAVDLMFYGSEQMLKLLARRGKEKIAAEAEADADAAGDLGIVLKPFKIRPCRNNCLFCFVSQLPKGMRRPLYLKDDDYRMSFLFGNYITMTNMTAPDRERIVEQRLSPLYLSVHSTSTSVRNRLIGNQKAADILKELRFLVDNRIRLHVQIVLCPGYNDGKDLERTISDLYRFYPYVMSVAVVPVGLTSHRKKAMRPVDRADASNALDTIHKFQARFRRKHGESIVYGADELYIKAEAELPPLSEYGDLPQIENGVGMVPQFLQQARRIKLPQALQDAEKGRKRRFVTFTGVSFYPYLSKFVNRLRKSDIDIEAVGVENTFFGQEVTVAGLLTGRDLMKSLSEVVKKDDVLLVPDIVMREGDEILLDDVSRQDIEDLLGVKAVVMESTPKGIVDAIAALS